MKEPLFLLKKVQTGTKFNSLKLTEMKLDLVILGLGKWKCAVISKFKD